LVSDRKVTRAAAEVPLVVVLIASMYLPGAT
jgi:hypothetical protein